MTGLRLTRAARERYGLADVELPGQIAEIRRLLQNVQRAGGAGAGLVGAHAGQLQAAWLINAALSLVVEKYRDEFGRDVFGAALASVNDTLGTRTVESVLQAYDAAFGAPGAQSAPVDALEQILFIWLANVNPAFTPMREFFDDAPLRATEGYEHLISSLGSYFAQRPPFGPDHQALIAMLRSPAIAFPDSLSGQLAYIRERWAMLLGELLERLLLGMDVLSEEERAMWLRLQGAGGFGGGGMGTRPGASVPVYDYSAFQGEKEAFTPDREWHPRLILIAKSVYVWLDQLSKQYGTQIDRLDQIPDEELDRLHAWGITGLWLIGIWERSRASEQIKRIRGNPDAAASAYALDDYRVAEELGGEDGWRSLSERAGQRGLKLAADMVPNHMGVDSRWVIEHPEWFLSLAEPPYPGYTFNGPELSPDPGVSIVIEDHYWDGSDAAVVFRRQDRGTGETRYVYHGNDGTMMPWNDTAQLNYIDANVREQVIQTILAVARRFPVIRFDAAMVLTRQHMRRLWWPEPGSGGAIPSRAERSISAAAFDQAMPGEFWRDVVDRVAAEGLDTLLLAEAFWLLEGYFVRTLGMHRVYNSAFMNMLRDERNAEYHLVMRNTLEFDPEVLKRFVNFMSNPDEETAVDQFGKGDKYFGACTMLVTLPGLPMFGHGQVEGFTEKYGMEYRRAYLDESVDQELVARHEREIFPLLRRRSQFAEVRDFLLYNFETDGGGVNEDVFAYSNGTRLDRSLIIFHNRYASTAGTIRQSVEYIVKDGQDRRSVRRSLAEGLGLPTGSDDAYVTFRDPVAALEYVRPVREIRERGIRVELGAYQRSVLLDFNEVYDGPAGLWRRLHERLGGRGVPSLIGAMDELVLETVQAPFARVVNAGIVRRLVEVASDTATDADRDDVIASVSMDAWPLASAAAELRRGEAEVDQAQAVAAVESGLRALLSATGSGAGSEDARDPAMIGSLLALVAIRGVGPSDGDAARYLDEWRLTPIVAMMFRELGVDDGRVATLADAVRTVAESPAWSSERGITPTDVARSLVERWTADETGQHAIGVNRHEGVDWFGAEAFEHVVRLAGTLQTMRLRETTDLFDPAERREQTTQIDEVTAILLRAAQESGYRLDTLQRAFAPAAGTASVDGAAKPATRKRTDEAPPSGEKATPRQTDDDAPRKK